MFRNGLRVIYSSDVLEVLQIRFERCRIRRMDALDDELNF